MAKVLKDAPKIDAYKKDFLLDLYRNMVKIRVFDENLCRLLQEGKVSGFHHSGVGQEAIAAGECASLRDDDYLFYDHRGCNEMIAKGVPLDKLYGDFMGKITGTTRGLGAGIVHSADLSRGVLGQSGTIGVSYTLAAGVGYSIKMRKTDQVCVCHFGDGAAAREPFHGGLNWAGLYKLPVIFMLENNQYGISLNYKKAHSLKEDGNIADRADAYGIPAYVIDGNNVLMVYEVVKKAVERARKGEGPTFIEAMTFRQRGHFEGDPVTYIDPKVTEDWKTNRDPIKNFKAELIKSGKAVEEEINKIDSEVNDEVLNAIKAAEEAPLPPKERIYEGLFSTVF